MSPLIARIRHLRLNLDSALSIILVVAALLAIMALASRISTPWQVGRYGGDLGAYFTVGRGILNGLVPYRDLFETKPPGIFLLAALSLRLTGGDNLYLAAHLVAVVGVPLALLAFAIRESRGRSRLRRLNLCLFAWVTGAALALYTFQRGEGYQTEDIGAFFAVLYLLFVCWERERLSASRTVLASLCLLGALGMKEPFVLAILGAALLVAEGWPFFVRAFLVPAMIAIVAGTVLLAALGYLGPYLHIYLPEILTGRLRSDRTYMLPDSGGQKFAAYSPLWLRALGVGEFVQNLGHASPVPLLAPLLAFLFAANPVCKSPRLSWRWALAALIVTGLSLYGLHQVFLFLQLLEALHFRLPLSDAFFRQLCLRNGLLAAACLAGCVILLVRQRSLCYRVLTALAAVSCLALAVGAGGDYFPQHHLFAVPGYVAVLFVVIRAVAREPAGAIRWLWVFSATLCLPLVFWHLDNDTSTNREPLAVRQQERAREEVVARQLDALLAACRWDRYFLLEERNNPLPYLYPATRHSPFEYGYRQKRAIGDHANPQFRQKILDDLANASVIVTHLADPNQIENPTERAVIHDNFRSQSPPCAEGFLPLADARIQLLFRTGESGSATATLPLSR